MVFSYIASLGTDAAICSAVLSSVMDSNSKLPVLGRGYCSGVTKSGEPLWRLLKDKITHPVVVTLLL